MAPNDEISESKKLLVLLSKRFLIGGVILGSVINRPKNKSFLVATSDSIEFRPESFSSKGPKRCKLGNIENMFEKPVLTSLKLQQ